MRWRPFTWLLLSVFFFVAAAYFWRLGDEWAAKKAQPAGLTATNQPGAKPLAKPAAQASAFRIASQNGSLNIPPKASTTPSVATNSAIPRLANRLSNTSKTVGQLMHSDSSILLQNALIDTEQPVAMAIPEHLRAHGDPGSYIVQSRRALDENFRALLTEAGAQIVSYIPNNAYLVLASAAAAQRMAGDPQTRSVLPYEPYYKISSARSPQPVAQNQPRSVFLAQTCYR